jgi:hypothetical protein
MLIELIVAAVMVMITVTMHGAGLYALARVLRLEAQEAVERHIDAISWRSGGIMLAIVMGIFVLHGAEIWIYAGFYHAVGAVADFRTAIYFSTITYGAIGYNDSAIAVDWHLVAAIEGINGVLLIGWTTAFFVRFIAVMGRH